MDPGKHKRIQCITIDEITKELGLKRLDMIKMDIEGAEIEALQGADDTIKQFSPVFAIASYHKRDKKRTFHKVEESLIKQGYEAYTFFPPHLTTCGKIG